MNRFPSRFSKPLDPTAVTTHHISDLIAKTLQKMANNYEQRTDLLLAAWPEIIGERFASQTQALSFVEGTLMVKVKNSTLYSLLNQYERTRLLKVIQKKFPKVEIKNIVFRMG